MIKIDRTEVFGWESAIRGMRNPMNSWDKSDSECYVDLNPVVDKGAEYRIGKNDLSLMQKLIKAGSDHSKFMRMINVTCDITAPLYWWKEYDTYKVGTVANSCSTMHKIHAKEFTLDDFSHEHLTLYDPEGEICRDWLGDLEDLIDDMNIARKLYLETNDKKYWWQMIQLLPSSYNQKRTVQLNYQVLKNIYFSRRNHKLDCWHTFCDWMLTLPYFKEVCVDVG
jgi:hypothetical protein